MVVNELNSSPSYRLSKLLGLLESHYGLTIDFEAAANTAELQSILESYDAIKAQIIQESAFNSYNHNPEYVKAGLIQEAIQIFLSEVAPKRIHRRRKQNPSEGA